MSAPTLLPEDILVHSDARALLINRLDNRQARVAAGFSNPRIFSYGKNAIDLVTLRETTMYESEEVFNTAQRWQRARFRHMQYIVSNPQLFLSMFTTESREIVVKHAGLRTTWKPEDVEYLFIKPEAITRLFASQTRELNASEGSDIGTGIRPAWVITNTKLANAIEDRYSEGIGDVLKAKWMAKAKSFLDAINNMMGMSYTTGYMRLTPDAERGRAVVLYSDRAGVPISQMGKLFELLDAMQGSVDLALMREMRTRLYRETVERTEQAKYKTNTFDARKYAEYWDKVKQNARVNAQSVSAAALDFATIPLLPAGSTTSRTWGIEIETMHAERTSCPAGWDEHGDGSLEPAHDSDGCSCDCDSCNGNDCGEEDCGDCYSHCGSYDCEDSATSECAEFVSPILRSFNSRGLRMLCDEIGLEGHNTTPGIHVHVGAGDLTVQDVSRLVYAYGVISPLLKSLYHREVFGYCEETPSNVMRTWLAQVRDMRRGNLQANYTPTDVVSNSNISRYLDVNLQALQRHGTVEFRAMGPWYDYNHLVRWAWLCREMVNISKVDVPQREWTACKSVADVVGLLRKYGIEMPYGKDLPDTIDNDADEQ